MKKSAIAAAVFSAAMSFNACSNYNGDVYGPPPEVEWVQETESETTEADTKDSNSETVSETEAEDSFDTSDEDASDTDTENTEEAVPESNDTEEKEE